MTDGSFADSIVKAMQAIAAAPVHQAEEYTVHPDEDAWIRNPVGSPPTWNAVMVAWQLGAIDGDHPAAQELMAQLGY